MARTKFDGEKVVPMTASEEVELNANVGKQPALVAQLATVVPLDQRLAAIEARLTALEGKVK